MSTENPFQSGSRLDRLIAYAGEQNLDVHLFHSRGRITAITLPKPHSRALAQDDKLRHAVQIFMAKEFPKPEADRNPPFNKKVARFLRELGMLPEITA